MAIKGQKSPRTVTSGLRQRAWWVLRARGTVTLPQILASIADGSEKTASSNLSRYFRALERAGIVERLAQREAGRTMGSNGFVRYRLRRNNGRLAPVHRASSGAVFDPNTGEVFSLKGGSDEQLVSA